MESTSSPKDFYFVGGTMSLEARSYVERRADTDLFDGLMAGEFCYVLTSRQMGKSSLMVRTARKLRQSGISVAVLDLTAVGNNLTAEQWYAGLLLQLGQRLNLEDELLDFWPTAPHIGPLQRWMQAIQTILLPAHPDRVVIFIDEIDTVRSLPFKTDEFFAGIRECYNLRSEVPALNRLSFCLLGVATPSDLISNTLITPFNIGRRIELSDFEESEAMPLAEGLRQPLSQNQELLRRMLYWTGGHPYLTQRLCQFAVRAEEVKTLSDVDRICSELFFTRRAREQDDNLLFVRDRILRSEGDLAGLLSAYGKILKGQRVRDDETNLLLSTLRLSGITRVEAGCLKVRNRIYERLFNKRWIRDHFPDAERRRQRNAFLKGAFGIAAVLSIILAIIIGLYLRANREAENRRSLLYLRQMGLAWQEYDVNANVDRAIALLRECLPQPGQRDLRSSEWYQLWHSTHRELWGESLSDEITGAVFSQDGSRIFLAHLVQAKDAKVYKVLSLDVATQKILSSFQAPAGKNFLPTTFSPDRSRFASDNPDDKINVWDVQTGGLLKTYDGTGNPLTIIRYSPDGRWLIGGDLYGNIKLIDLVSERQFSASFHQRIVAISFSSDNRQLIIADTSNTLHRWDLVKGAKLAPLQKQYEAFEQVAFLPRSAQFLTSNDTGLLMIWNSDTMRRERELAGHVRSIRSIAISPNEQILATSSLDRTVHLWSMKTWKEIGVIKGHGTSVNILAWAPDSSRLLTGSASGSLKLWDVHAASQLRLPEEAVKSILATRFRDHDKPLAFGTTQTGERKIWDLGTGTPLAQLSADDSAAIKEQILFATFSPNGALLATGGTSGQIKLWDAADGKLLRAIDARTGYVYNFVFSPDGEKLISGGRDQVLCVWETGTGKFLGEIGNKTSNDYRVALSPDGQMLAAARKNGSVTLWSFPQLREIRTLAAHSPPISYMTFSPDSNLLATAGNDSKIILWEVRSGRNLSEMVSIDIIQRLLFSPDGLRLVSGSRDGAIKLWDVTSGQEVLTYKGHSGQVSSLSFGPDRKSLITSSQDGTVRFWPAATEENVARQLSPQPKSEPTP